MQGKTKWNQAALTTLGLLMAGCTQAPPPQATTSGSRYLLDQPPANARSVIAAREVTADGESIVVVGRIGGSANPWIADRAAFTIVDNSIEACSDIPGDNCKTPWDYCCRTAELPKSTALVKFVNADGELVAVDARQLWGVKELDRVTVQGRAQRDEEGNLTVLASKLYVER